MLRYEDNAEPVGVHHRHPVLVPVWVGRGNRIHAEARLHRPNRFIVSQIEDEQRLAVGVGRGLTTARCEVKMSAAAVDSQENPS
jgi:hypothetical protein